MAHIDQTANVAWMCWPQFDSDFVFGSLLDKTKGGNFSIKPAENDYMVRQFYLRNTNMICTEFKTSTGAFRVVDFAPRFFQYERTFRPVMLMRKIELISGTPKIKITCQPRKNYGEDELTPRTGSSHITYEGAAEPVRLYSDLPLSYITHETEFSLTKDQNLILSWGIKIEEDIRLMTENYFNRTLSYWLNWVKNSSIGTFKQKQVIRSALVLKLHQFEDTGAIIASSTTSLPEFPQSGRNWDYRYCWIRDSHYTLQALSSLGSFSELQKFEEYIHSLYRPDSGKYQPLYSITGEALLKEREIPLEGYLGNRPVRVGNQAHEQLQHDAYGQLLVSLSPLFIDSRFPKRYAKAAGTRTVGSLLTQISEVMDEPDAGLWEYRNRVQHHAYTYLFHWAGGKTGEKIGRYYRNEEIANLSVDVINKSSAWLEKCFDKEKGVYTDSVEGNHLDASLLQLITMHYLDPKSEKAHQHLRVLEQHLKTEEGLFFRYRHDDDFGEPETTFLICSFWYVEALTAVGRVEEAIEAFEQLMTYGNHLGLLPEDIASEDGSQWGNFPQTYSHVGLLNAAFRISNQLDKPLYLV